MARVGLSEDFHGYGDLEDRGSHDQVIAADVHFRGAVYVQDA